MVISNKEQETIISIASRYGCISMQQVYDLMPQHTHTNLQMLTTQLINNEFLDVVGDDILVLHGCKDRYKKKTIDMLWAIIRLSKGNIEEIMDVMVGVPPVDYVLTVNHKNSYKMVMASESTISYLSEQVARSYEKKQIRNKEAHHLYDFFSCFVLIATSEKVVSVIKEYDFPETIYVMYLDYYTTQKPVFKLLKKSPKVVQNKDLKR